MASEAPASRAYVLYGVAGCGKTTLGRALVERLNDAAPETGRDAVFVDADDLHSPEAREKMSRGEPLTETDREPWLARVRARMLDSARPRDVDGRLTHRDVVVACSALKRDHRASLVRDEEAKSKWLASVDFVFLRVHSKAALERRLRARQESSGHFFPASLLQSQLDTLELPSDDARTACHVFDADVYPSTNAACAALFSYVATTARARLEWEETARAFLDDWYARLRKAGLADTLSNDTQIDHVCFRCGTEAVYRDTLAKLRRAGHVVAGASNVGGREITTVRLRPPFFWRGRTVNAVEVPMPKKGRPKPDGWEHAEVALMRGGVEGAEHLEALRLKYPSVAWELKGLAKALNAELSFALAGDPGMAVKFHHRPLLEVVAYEIERGMAQAPPPGFAGFANETPTFFGRKGKRARGDDEDDEAKKKEKTSDDAATTSDADAPPGENETTKPDSRKMNDLLSVFADPLVTFGLEMREPWAGMVLRGEKTVETRGYAIPEALLGRPVVLLAAPESSDRSVRPKAFLPDAAPAGAASAVGLVTFGSCAPYASKRAFMDDFANHRVGPDSEFGAWEGPGASGANETPMFAWRVSEVLPMPAPAPSPAATRVLRSLFRLDDDAETSLVGRDDACVSELSDDDKGRWDDDGENDRPWH